MSDRNLPSEDGAIPPRDRPKLPSEWPYDADAVGGFPMPCLVLAGDGRVQLANEDAAALLAESASGLRGQNLFSLLPSLQTALESDARPTLRLELRGQAFDLHAKRRTNLRGETSGWVVALAEQPGAARALKRIKDVEIALGGLRRALDGSETEEHRDISAGGSLDALSPRQREIALHLTRGRAPKDIANALAVSVHTVRTQIKQIYMRLGVRSQLELAAHVSGSRGAVRE